MTTLFSLPDMVWSCLSSDGDLETVFADVSPETRSEVKLIALDLWMRFNDKKLHLQDTFNRLSAAAENRADFEQLANAHPDREVLLTMGFGADTDAQVWQRVKPE